MGLVDHLRGRARKLTEQFRRDDLGVADKAVALAQRSIAAVGLSSLVSIGRHDIYELTAPPEIMLGLGDLVIRTAGDADLEGVCSVDETAPALVRERLRRGDLVYVGLQGGHVLCHVWFHRGPKPFTEDEPALARWALGPTTFWSYGGAAVSSARSSGVFVKLFQTALADLFQLHGATSVRCRIARTNALSIMLHERLGFERLGTFSGFSTPWLRSLVWQGPPLISFVFGPNSTRALSLPPGP